MALCFPQYSCRDISDLKSSNNRQNTFTKMRTRLSFVSGALSFPQYSCRDISNLKSSSNGQNTSTKMRTRYVRDDRSLASHVLNGLISFF